MINIQNADTTSACFRIKTPNATNGWSLHFREAGWRIFYRDICRDGSVLYWLIKRGASAILIPQQTSGERIIDFDLPSEDAAELASLIVKSGLAVPA
jgi:hypothetical protein